MQTTALDHGNIVQQPDRRRFLQGTSAMGLTLAFGIPKVADAQEPAVRMGVESGWLSIDPLGRISLICPKSEMGQGTWTAWAIIAADELDVAVANIRIVQSTTDLEKYRDPLIRKQATFGSTGVSAWFDSLSIAAASLRLALIDAAATQWKVPAFDCLTENGQVIHRDSGRRLNYAGLVNAARSQPLPKATPKPRLASVLVGKSTPRIDSADKVIGRARYGIDRQLPGMSTALLVLPPLIGGEVASLDGRDAMAVKGVKAVLPVTGGVAVIADGFHHALRGKQKLKVEWRAPSALAPDGPALQSALRGALTRDGVIVRKDGQPAEKLATAMLRHSATYDAPYLPHMPMEPLNCTAHFKDGVLDIWVGTQDQEETLKAAKAVSGLADANIRIHTELLGGGFGRRAATDFVRPAIELAMKRKEPVKLIIERADELRMGHFRPAAAAQFDAAIDETGRITAFLARVACPSISKPFFGANQKNSFGEHDFFASQGISSPVYDIADRETRWLDMPSPFTPWIWRGVGMSQNLFFLESFIDELAALAKLDPLEFRRRNVKNSRAIAMLDRLDSETAWRKTLPQDRAWGMGLQLYNNAGFALIAEVSMVDGAPRVHRVDCVVDAGRVVNPDQVIAQTEGGIVMGLGAALFGGIAVKDGAVAQSNFHDMKVARMGDAPAIRIHLIDQGDKVHGMGEYTTALICPAVANAVARLSGDRHRSFPFVRPA